MTHEEAAALIAELPGDADPDVIEALLAMVDDEPEQQAGQAGQPFGPDLLPVPEPTPAYAEWLRTTTQGFLSSFTDSASRLDWDSAASDLRVMRLMASADHPFAHDAAAMLRSVLRRARAHPSYTQEFVAAMAERGQPVPDPQPDPRSTGVPF